MSLTGEPTGNAADRQDSAAPPADRAAERLVVPAVREPASRWRRPLVWALKLAVLVAITTFALSGIAWEDTTVLVPAEESAAPARELVQPGMRSLVENVDRGGLLAAVLLAGPGLFLMTFRWRTLLRAAGIDVPFASVVRLTYVGHFFNLFVPGGTGGDVIKGFGIARLTTRKAEAVATILLDRVAGLLGLTLMAAIAVLFRFDQLGSLARAIGVFLVMLAAGLVVYLAPPMRRLFAIDRLLALMPLALRRFDAALVARLRNPRALVVAIAITVVMQLVAIGALSLGGRAIGITAARFADYLVLVPIGYLVNALPLSPGGLGLMEAAFQQLFAEAGLASPTQGFLFGLMVRLVSLVWALPGLVAWLVGGRSDAPPSS